MTSNCYITLLQDKATIACTPTKRGLDARKAMLSEAVAHTGASICDRPLQDNNSNY